MFATKTTTDGRERKEKSRDKSHSRSLSHMICQAICQRAGMRATAPKELRTVQSSFLALVVTMPISLNVSGFFRTVIGSCRRDWLLGLRPYDEDNCCFC